MHLKLFFAVIVYLLLNYTCVYAGQPGDFHEKYKLEQVLVLSRHNIRTPLSGSGSALARITPHKWFEWTSGPADLSLRGGELETLMGQYFRKWLVKEKLITENYIPRRGEMLFYSNSRYRTIATAQYFAGGMLPVANVRIRYNMEPGGMDPVFHPKLTFSGDNYHKLVLHQLEEKYGGAGLPVLRKELEENYRLIGNILDMEHSEMALKDNFPRLRTDDINIVLTAGKEPAVKGSLRLAVQASDALILQYYEEADPVKAAFGHELSLEEWRKIGDVKDIYGSMLFKLPAVAVNVANPLLKLMRKELLSTRRRFTFLCGHETNIASVLAALQIEPYDLPDSVESRTPMGVKLVINKWRGKDGESYISLDMVYQTVRQLRERTMLDLNNPPAVFPLKLQGITQNEYGLYPVKDVLLRFDSAIAGYKSVRKNAE